MLNKINRFLNPNLILIYKRQLDVDYEFNFLWNVWKVTVVKNNQKWEKFPKFWYPPSSRGFQFFIKKILFNNFSYFHIPHVHRTNTIDLNWAAIYNESLISRPYVWIKKKVSTWVETWDLGPDLRTELNSVNTGWHE